MPVRTNNEAANLLIVIVPMAVTGYLMYFVFGLRFIFDELPFLLGGFLLLLLLRQRSWAPAVFLVVQVPFQGLLVQHLGLKANFLTLIAVGAFLSMHPPERLPRVLLGTRVQRLTALLVLGVSVSMLGADHDLTTIVSLFQKVTLFLIVGAVIHSLNGLSRVTLLVWALAISTAAMYALSEAAFYFGRDLIPISGSGSGILNVDDLSESPVTYGLRGVGQSVGQNRFAFLAILPATLTIGLLLTKRQRWMSVVAIGVLAILAFGLVISGSRSGSLGVLTALGLVILYAPGVRNRIYVLGAVVMLSAVGFWLIQELPTGSTSLDRFFDGSSESDSYYHASGTRIDQGRLDVWREGVEIFRESPLSGVGLRRFPAEIRARLPESRAREAHSGYIQLLAETGLLGIVPYGLLLVYVFYVLVRSVREEASDQHVWRVVFLAAFVGMATNTAFGTYQFDRFFWIPIAFAGMLELRERQRRQTKAGFSAPESARVHSAGRVDLGDSFPRLA